MDDTTQPTESVDQPYEVFDLDTDDAQLIKMAEKAREASETHWNKTPWELDKADDENFKYWLGDQMAEKYDGASGKKLKNMGNRLMTSTRAVLAYVNSRVANPEVAPSDDTADASQFAKDIRSAMYQHGIDNDLKPKTKKATNSLVIQKRGYLFLRWDPTLGINGDIAIDHVPAEDIILDEATVWGSPPPRFWRKQRCSVEELIAKFPDKKAQIKQHYEVNSDQDYQNLNKRIMYLECWFSYLDQGVRQEGLMWYIPKVTAWTLGKMKNPNFIYTGNPEEERAINYLPQPVKPLISFGYMGSGKSGIDETSLFEQAKVLQDLYNKRKLQIMRANDRQRGKTIVDSGAAKEEDVKKFFMSNNDQSVLMIKPSQGQNVSNSVMHVPNNPLPREATEEAYDYRNEIDTTMGTPNIFRGEQSKNNTLGQDERIIEQAGALQDDLAAAIDDAMKQYYRILFHMMKVYYDEDHWFAIKGDNGSYDFVVLSTDLIDSNVKVSVQAGSTMPENAREVRDVAIDAASANKIDDLSFWEALTYGKLPEPGVIVERLQKQLNDPARFLSDVEQLEFNREAATDIALILSDREPPVRDEYGQAYLEYFNKFIMSNKFVNVPPEKQDALKFHVAAAGATAARTAELQATQVDDAAAAGVDEPVVAETM